MTVLKLQPDLLPLKEKLVLVPQFRGISGSATLTCSRSNNVAEFKVQSQLGMFLFKNALNFEGVCSWRKNQDQWSLTDYVETNHKSGKRKNSAEGLRRAHEKYGNEQILGPVSLLYALRGSPLQDVGESRFGYLVRAETPISVEIMAKERREKQVKAFGGSPRKQLRIELLIQTAKSPQGIKVFADGKASLWIDQETNVITEVNYEIPPFGALTMALEQMS